MSEIKTYTCDVCKGPAVEAQLAKLRLNVTRKAQNYQKTTVKELHICGNCLNTLDITLPEFQKDVSIDDQLCEVLAEYIQAVVEDGQ